MEGGKIMSQRTLVITQNLDESYVQKIKEVIPDWQIISGKEKSVWQDHLQDAEIIAGWKRVIAEKLDI